MNLHLFLASLAATLSLGIAAQASPAKVACVGDSITFGSGLKPGEARDRKSTRLNSSHQR